MFVLSWSFTSSIAFHSVALVEASEKSLSQNGCPYLRYSGAEAFSSPVSSNPLGGGTPNTSNVTLPMQRRRVRTIQLPRKLLHNKTACFPFRRRRHRLFFPFTTTPASFSLFTPLYPTLHTYPRNRGFYRKSIDTATGTATLFKTYTQIRGATSVARFIT